MFVRSILPSVAVAIALLPGAALAADGHKGTFKGAGVAGSLTLTDAPKGVLLRIEVSGLAPGWHGMHFHEKGNCSDEKFTAAGAHVHDSAAATVVHGFMNANANDAGDLPNLYVGADGKASVEVYSTLVSVSGAEGRPALLDADGAAVVIHASPDDYTAQPIGGAGARVACAVIE
jgi:Cu-Zn family superoxide dismutase